MLPIDLSLKRDNALRVLFLGAHCDDIEIGCGGTIQRLIDAYPMVEVQWFVFSGSTVREQEAMKSAECYLEKVELKTVTVSSFRNGYFPYIGSDIKDYFESIKQEFSPDIIFTHYRNDLHQDHRVISDLTWNTFRDHIIWEYEIPKYDGDLGAPNLFVTLEKQHCETKIERLMRCFETQVNKHWFKEDLFYSLMRLRGMESGSSSGYSEAFYSRKLTF